MLRNKILRMVLWPGLLAVGGGFGLTFAEAAKKKEKAEIPYEAFEPAAYFVPESPMCEVLEVEIEPKKPIIYFGDQPQFIVKLRNISDQPINLAGHPESGMVFSPHMRMGYYRDDMTEISENVDFDVPTGHEVLAPGGTLQTEFPTSRYLARHKHHYRLKPDALVPGKYKAYLNFWVLDKGENTRAISKAAEFSIKSDGSKDVAITKNMQTGKALPKGFEFKLEPGPGKTVRLYGVNKSGQDVYLGNDWRWRRRYPGKAATIDREIPRLTRRVLVKAGTRKLLAQEKIMGATFKGTYEIQFYYYNGLGKLVAKSNVVKSKL